MIRPFVAPEPKSKGYFIATVINAEDFDSDGRFQFGDVVCISLVDDPRSFSPGDLILDADRQGAFIRELRSLDSLKGPGRGRLLCELDSAIMLGDSGRFCCLGRVAFRIGPRTEGLN